MKIIRLLPSIAVALGVFWYFSLVARADDEADRAALRLIRTNYMEAVDSGDLSKIAPYLSKEVTGVMVTGEAVTGLEGLQAYWKKIQDLIGPGGTYNVTLNVEKTDLYGGVAVSHGHTDDVVRLANGKELRFNSYWTAVCRKEDGAWKVVRLEATMNPVDNVFISLRLQKARLVCGFGGVAAGAVLTLALGLAIGRARRTNTKATH